MIRAAEPADVDAVAALEEENLGVDAWSRGLVEDGIAGGLPTVEYLVAEAADPSGDSTPGAPGLVGYAVVSIVADVAELQRIAVTPAHRRTGVASALLAEVATLAARRGAERLLLEVREDNLGAARFYATRGFAELDRRRGYYRDGTTAVVLCRDLPAP